MPLLPLLLNPPAPPAITPTADWDVRLYDSSGKRKSLPKEWISTFGFEIRERGGMATGWMQVGAAWENFQPVGTERVDIYLFGEIAYRGWLLTAQNEIGNPERSSPTLYGLIEWLNRWQVQCQQVYSASQDISVVFSALANAYAKRAGRLPALAIDSQTIGVSVKSFDARNKTLSQAFNQLCDIAPGQCVWGSDVDSSGQDRLYLRPRSATVAYVYSVGGNVEHFGYPRDYTRIVNRLLISGGKAPKKNLISNGSFEEVRENDENSGNLLKTYSASFEYSGLWTLLNGATIQASGSGLVAGVQARTGAWLLELDTNTEEAYQETPVNYRVPMVASVWARRESLAGASNLIVFIEGRDNGGTIWQTASQIVSPLPSDTDWHNYTVDLDFTAQPNVTKVRFRVYCTTGSEGDTGTLVDDVGLWSKYGQSQQEWRLLAYGVAGWEILDWACTDAAAAHGCYSVKVKPSGIGGGSDYLEIAQRLESRAGVKAQTSYSLLVAVRSDGVNSVSLAFGCREYDGDGAVVATRLSPTSGNNAVTWYVYQLQFTTTATTEAVECFVRVLNNQIIYIDAAMLIEGVMPTDEMFDGLGVFQNWWDGEAYERRVDVATAGLSLSAAAAASITTYGEREEQARQESVTDRATALAYAQGVFNARAGGPEISARLTVSEPTALPGPDGLVRVVGLPASSKPETLFPSVIRATMASDRLQIDLDLGNAQPEWAGLLRAVESKQR